MEKDDCFVNWMGDRQVSVGDGRVSGRRWAVFRPDFQIMCAFVSDGSRNLSRWESRFKKKVFRRSFIRKKYRKREGRVRNRLQRTKLGCIQRRRNFLVSPLLPYGGRGDTSGAGTFSKLGWSSPKLFSNLTLAYIATVDMTVPSPAVWKTFYIMVTLKAVGTLS